ncbi:unnamed protein product [Brassica oleracea var. botrytis]|uniref:F-box domain-containing protein n=1 Tax=Brassica oleracea var. oleracea TaxID=109376 RepID=A0A0D3BJK0_BRAOL|nr:PREDICTED: F-box/kelch-repeat protein At4g39753-like [Brassica oleracea var. oleracea]
MLYSWVQAVASAATSLIVEPPWKKRKPNPPPPLSFLSLPDVIILNCLARVSRSYYPKLSLVSKTFRSLILSIDLNHARFHHQTQEDIFYICLQLPDRPLPTWFTLWIKPDEEEVKKRSIFVQVPSSYDSREPLSYCTVGSDLYALRQSYPPSPSMFVRNKKSVVWRNAPNMTVPRAYPVACKLDGKIYVMGGCNDDKSKKSCWGEVFDTNTQTWETLPNPKAELRFSSMIRETQIIEGKIYVRSIDEIDSVYDPKTRKWDATEKALVDDSRSMVMVGDLYYSCRAKSCKWYDTKCDKWKLVKGLSSLNKSYCRRGLIETVEYCGKLLIIWDKFAQPRRYCHEKTICCALVAFEKRQNGQVWGKVEWSNAGLTVSSSYVYMRYLVNVL